MMSNRSPRSEALSSGANGIRNPTVGEAPLWVTLSRAYTKVKLA